eukprot:COSAG05_NODE_107_length_18696_cov_209.227766_9_plen_179_part_00
MSRTGTWRGRACARARPPATAGSTAACSRCGACSSPATAPPGTPPPHLCPHPCPHFGFRSDSRSGCCSVQLRYPSSLLQSRLMTCHPLLCLCCFAHFRARSRFPVGPSQRRQRHCYCQAHQRLDRGPPPRQRSSVQRGSAAGAWRRWSRPPPGSSHNGSLFSDAFSLLSYRSNETSVK